MEAARLPSPKRSRERHPASSRHRLNRRTSPARRDRPQGIRPAGAAVEGSQTPSSRTAPTVQASRATDRDIKSDSGIQRGRLDRATAGAPGPSARAWSPPARQSSTAPMNAPSSGPYRASRSAGCNGPLGLDGRCRAQTAPHRPVGRRSVLRTDIGQQAVRHAPSGSQRSTLQLFAGGIMRGRKQSRSRGPMRGRQAFRRGRRVSSESDAQVDESLRGLARLLARQAAREEFNRAMSREADRLLEEGRE